MDNLSIFFGIATLVGTGVAIIEMFQKRKLKSVMKSYCENQSIHIIKLTRSINNDILKICKMSDELNTKASLCPDPICDTIVDNIQNVINALHSNVKGLKRYCFEIDKSFYERFGETLPIDIQASFPDIDCTEINLELDNRIKSPR